MKKILYLFYSIISIITFSSSQNKMESNDDNIIDSIIYHNAYSYEEALPDSKFPNNEWYVSDSSFMTKYFKNLKGNIIDNYLGVCGYTSLGMLLSFYDSYWNDNTIRNQYDVCTNVSSIVFNNQNSTNYESPGVKNIHLLI